MLQRFVEPRERECGRRPKHQKARYQPGPDLLTAAQLAPWKLPIAGDSHDRPVRPELQSVLPEERLPAPTNLLRQRFDVLGGESLSGPGQCRGRGMSERLTTPCDRFGGGEGRSFRGNGGAGVWSEVALASDGFATGWLPSGLQCCSIGET